MGNSHPGPPPSPSHNDNSTGLNILLCGKAGSGKSTLGNMLVRGTLQPPLPFFVDSCINSVTDRCQVSRDRPGYTVTDTAGFQGAAGGTEDEQAKDLLARYLNTRSESYSHIIFVQRAGRLVPLDDALWEVFKTMFKGAEAAFMLVISSMDEPNWIERNKTELQKRFGNVRKVGVDFKSSRDPVLDAEYAAERIKYQESLDEALQGLYDSNSGDSYTPAYANDPKRLEKIFKKLAKIAKKHGYRVLNLILLMVEIAGDIQDYFAS